MATKLLPTPCQSRSQLSITVGSRKLEYGPGMIKLEYGPGMVKLEYGPGMI